MARLAAALVCVLVCSPLQVAADDFGRVLSSPRSFRVEVETALEQLRRMLEEERHPQYPADVAHTYEDKYLLAELATKAASAGMVQLFSGLLDNTWPGFDGKPLPSWATGAPLLIFTFCEFTELQQTVDKEIQVAPDKIEEVEGILGTWKSTVRAKTKVHEHLWNWTATWSLYVTTEGAEQGVTLLSGAQGKMLKTMTTPPAEPQQPRPTAQCAPTLELDVSWLARRLRTGMVDFAVNRTAPDCHTPARNQEVQAALGFFQRVYTFGQKASKTLQSQLGRLVSDEAHDVGKPGDVFQPVLALFALDGSGSSEARPTLSADMEVVLAAHRRGLLSHRDGQIELWGRIAASKEEEVNRSLVSLLIVVQEMASLATQITSAIRALERMLYDQLTAAVGKTIEPIDFSEYMEFHGRQLLRPDYQPSPFVFAVRHAQHHPEGTVSIEAHGRSSTHQAISTFRLHREAAPAMRLQLNSAATVSLTGEHFVHAAIFHRFAHQANQDLRLVARARQLSCFVLLVGKITAADTFKPAAALIIQNKDDLVIPLLTETVPSPKEFLDSIQSLSPEQQRFAKAFRKMQLSSSLFAVAIVQIKPALEKVLNLPEHSLTKEIQLTQDLIELFVRYQVAPDLMSFEPWATGLAEKAARIGTAEKITAVKAHVKSLWETIAASKQKQLQEKEEEVKMRKDCRSHQKEDDDIRDMMHDELGYVSDELGTAPVRRKQVPDAKRHSSPLKLEAATALYMEAAPQMRSSRSAQSSSSASSPQEPPPSPPPPSPRQAPAASQAESSGALDYTALPHQLDANYLKFDTDAVLRPTTIDLATTWTKQEQPGLLGDPRSRQLMVEDQRQETNKAFDLLDALSRSGAEALESSLHVLVAATHCFDETILKTVVQQNKNPIEKMERSMLILASTLHQASPSQLVQPSEADRVRTLSPGIFAGLAAAPKQKLA